MIAAWPPRLAPAVVPSSAGSASGLRNSPCTTTPATASDAPVSSAAHSRDSRSSSSASRSRSSPRSPAPTSSAVAETSSSATSSAGNTRRPRGAGARAVARLRQRHSGAFAALQDGPHDGPLPNALSSRWPRSGLGARAAAQQRRACEQQPGERAAATGRGDRAARLALLVIADVVVRLVVRGCPASALRRGVPSLERVPAGPPAPAVARLRAGRCRRSARRDQPPPPCSSR